MAPIPTEEPFTTSTAAESNPTISVPKDTDTSIPDATPPPAPPPPAPTSPLHPKKRKRKDKPQDKHAHILHQATFRKTTWSYFHLILLTPGTAPLPPTTTTTTNTTRLSPLLLSSLLTSPLQSYLGTTGAAIPIDMLKISGRSIWLRVPRQDARGFRASLSGWVGTCEGDEVPGVERGMGRVGVAWRVVREGGVLGGVELGSGGEDVFGMTRVGG